MRTFLVHGGMPALRGASRCGTGFANSRKRSQTCAGPDGSWEAVSQEVSG